MSAPQGTVRLEATVHGTVQGVGFRWFVSREAVRLDLTGWVRNEPDGSVRVVAEGTTAALDELVARLKEGPPAASVRDVDVSRIPATGQFRRFGIHAGGHRGD